jgi:hypothetical protein
MLVPLNHLRQEIVEASDEAARNYYAETPQDKKSNTGINVVMRAAARNKQQSFKGQFSKYTIVTNSKFGDELLEEVSASFLNPWKFFFIHYWINM